MKKQTQTTSIYTLSKELGVSTATISKALNNSVEISAERKKEIKELARKRNFVLRPTKRHIQTIGVIIQQHPNHPLDFSPYIMSILEGVAEYTREEKIEMSLYARSVDELNSGNLARELRRRCIDGIIVLCANSQSRFYDNLDEDEFPYFNLFSNNGSETDKILHIQEEEIGFRVTKHLIENGHHQIGVIVSPPEGEVGKERLAGYYRAHKELDIEVKEQLIEQGENLPLGYESGSIGVKNLISKNPEMTAVFTMSYQNALGAMKGIQKLGLTVPEDISLISCDNFPETEYLTPALTVVDIPYNEAGYFASKQVHRMINNLHLLDISDKINTSGKIIVRESVAPLVKENKKGK